MKNLFFTGLSCKFSQSQIISADWQNAFTFVPLNNIKAEEQAKMAHIRYGQYKNTGATVFGHSAGCNVALHYAIQNKKSVKHLVLIAPTPIPGMSVTFSILLNILKGGHTLDVLKGEMFPMQKQLQEKIFFNTIEQSAAWCLEEELGNVQGSVLRDMLQDWFFENPNWSVLLEGVRITVVIPTWDAAVPIKTQEGVAHRLAAETLYLYKAGHMLMFEERSDEHLKAIMCRIEENPRASVKVSKSPCTFMRGRTKSVK